MIDKTSINNEIPYGLLPNLLSKIEPGHDIREWRLRFQDENAHRFDASQIPVMYLVNSIEFVNSPRIDEIVARTEGRVKATLHVGFLSHYKGGASLSPTSVYAHDMVGRGDITNAYIYMTYGEQYPVVIGDAVILDATSPTLVQELNDEADRMIASLRPDDFECTQPVIHYAQKMYRFLNQEHGAFDARIQIKYDNKNSMLPVQIITMTVKMPGYPLTVEFSQAVEDAGSSLIVSASNPYSNPFIVLHRHNTESQGQMYAHILDLKNGYLLSREMGRDNRLIPFSVDVLDTQFKLDEEFNKKHGASEGPETD